jgi:hypothetical protein
MANSHVNDNDNDIKNIDLVNKLLESILDKNILELLKIINSNYPDKFPKKNINLEFEFIKNNIKFINSNKTNNSNNVININVNGGQKLNNVVSSNTKKVIKTVLDINRCNARIWNNIYERATLKEVSDIDKKFKVKDFADIKVKAFHEKYIVGTQCKRQKSSDSIYCFQHKTYLPHGNIFEIPSKELCFHYMKDGNYL